jgi:hypothetical protein
MIVVVVVIIVISQTIITRMNDKNTLVAHMPALPACQSTFVSRHHRKTIKYIFVAFVIKFKCWLAMAFLLV